MKKITLSVAILLGSMTAKSQAYDEYIDVNFQEWTKKSVMAIYNNAPDTLPIEFFSIGMFNSNYHWVRYKWANKVIVSMNDSYGSYRELCTKQGEKKTKCDTVDAYNTKYDLFATDSIFQVWISKPLKLK